MALKRKIEKSVWEDLNPEVKALYVEKNGSYVLDVESGEDDAAELKRAKDREAQRAKDEKKRADALQEQLDELTGNDAKKRGDIEVLERSWKEKSEKEKGELQAQIDKLKNVAVKALADSTATNIAKEISTVPSLMTKAIRERLAVDFDSDEPTLRVLDASGKPTAHTLDDLKKELVANKDFSSIIIGSKASGSGASKETKQQGRGSAPLQGADGQTKTFREMTPMEKVAAIKQRKEATQGE